MSNASAGSVAAVFPHDSSTGELSFDQDGNGAGAAVQLVILKNKPASLAVGDLVAA